MHRRFIANLLMSITKDFGEVMTEVLWLTFLTTV